MTTSPHLTLLSNLRAAVKAQNIEEIKELLQNPHLSLGNPQGQVSFHFTSSNTS